MRPDATLTYPTYSADHIQGRDLVRHVVRAAIFCAFAVMVVMSWTRNINWDEFYFLSHVHANLDGRLDRPLQTVFVHGFGWLSWLSGHEVDQIAAARLAMMAFFAGTCFSLHRIAAALTDDAAADIAVLAFVTSGFAIAHGASFRADPMAAGLLMGATALMMTTRMGLVQTLVSALLCALALLVTVKSALYLPVFVGVLLWRWSDRGVVLRCLGAAVLAVVIAALLFVWHASTINVAEGADAGSNLSEAAKVTLGGSGFLPRWPEVSLWLMFSMGGVLLAVAGLCATTDNRLRAVFALFALPLLSVVIYRNAFPYFFPFAVPPLMIAVALGAYHLRGTLLFKLALVLMLASGIIQSQRAISEGNAAQRATIAEVRRIFPQPVSYLDQNGMLSSFERHGFFMSTWGIATYRAAGKPVIKDLIERHQPPLLLTNRAELHAAMRPEAADVRFLGLLPEDGATLRKSYVHHAGVIWIAGQDIILTDGSATAQMPFAGLYRLESAAPVSVDGVNASNGDVLALGASPIKIEGSKGAAVRLIWNTDADLYETQLPETGLYAGFWRL
ncbi:putative membrane protein [Sulfitobacter noctilucicola]|uniref:Glycosyltransferase RgtA/B/C/D-like domain-containing protein n=1 Tax=Sulfitobacter noctilucicola TaxID=1342301 RepID=A0A7W6M6D8_9RHOB|nr:hypothetical protein [Sulfitobacter noctilucicola]KIN62174.1 putative membrane protein [Sulfitobacter noctilucicola]MBB4173308.1 hypothetical protein [Sulfitobacter noctilucicola]